ncbi:hypothetical protein B0A55_02514 [Friedmanniomyces simplex]|uniref:Fe2OG dioxygenase domain-containing protein n=1 Tax=Friedmanniomyces simplex TaxID=329884 RepID=A0A4U0XVD8_9PEZI|nr:hypothetical protein B0A55_02514 [Friedmanniomyces simplex]
MAPLQLTQDQLDHFDNAGFLILRSDEHKLVDPKALQHWTDEIRSLPRVTRDEMLLFKDKINYKQAGGNGFQAHLDAPAYDHIGYIEHTTANIAVDPATIANGCVEVVPGSHKMNVELAEGGRISAKWEAEQQWVPVELESGDLLLFGSHLAHRSAPNKTAKPRASVYATYHMVSDGTDLRKRYYVDRRENFPPDHERVPGKDYGAGVKRYAFAAPFTKIAQPGSAQEVA